MANNILMHSQIGSNNNGRPSNDPKPKQQRPRFLSPHKLGQINEWYLSNNKCQKNGPKNPKNHGQEKLMQRSTEEKSNNLCIILINTIPNNKLKVEMSIKKNMDRFIPFPIKLLISC